MENPLIIKAAKKEKVDRTPAWMMRQAGRYLPEYQAVREKYDFLTMVRTPEIATEITLQPLRRFKIDAAIIFSDILVIPEAMGMSLEFVEKAGPRFLNPVRTPEQVDQLNTDIDLIHEQLSYVYEAIKMTRNELSPDKGLIGFSGAPWTLAAYMIEGKGSKNFIETKKFAFHFPKAFEKLLSKLSDAIASYLIQQVNSGAQIVQIFDSWAGVLTPDDFIKFCVQPVASIIRRIKSNVDVPVIYFPKGAIGSLLYAVDTGADVLSIDWTISLADARKLTNHAIALQGNMDPLYLFSSPEIIRMEVEKILQQMQDFNGHIFNLGHGVLPNTPVENVEAFFNAIYELSPSYH
jgi:uroporphyrinogen decarboxylase